MNARPDALTPWCPDSAGAEWLEADGLGGFASGTAGLVRTRRYHALLLAAATPPTGRMVLVSGFDATVTTSEGSVAISSHRYHPGVRHPDGADRIQAFSADPWPAWDFALPAGRTLRQECVVEHGTGLVVLQWTLLDASGPTDPVRLCVRPLLAGRDYHSLMHENAAFRFEAVRDGGALTFRPYDGVPGVVMGTSGHYRAAPAWYRQFHYDEEAARGLDALEDLASPGELTFDLIPGIPAVWVLAIDASPGRAAEAIRRCDGPLTVAALAHDVVAGERQRRSRFASPLERAADAYIVERREGRTIVAGYPWFTDWGRDTFIALRGLCLATGRLAEAREILLEWAAAVSQGMLPNRFPDRGEEAEFNAVDASLWFVIAVQELRQRAERAGGVLTAAHQATLVRAVLDIVNGYAAGTRFGIRMDADGLLAAGVPGVQLTWMDARVGDWVITPRIGKPVEVQALWINALAVAAQFDPRRAADQERARQAFEQRFWDEARGCLFDVIDVDHVAGTTDARLRPNQIFAVGGLPVSLLTGARARRVVDVVEATLWTPLGLRSLAPGEDGYAAHYVGDGAARDAVYHQGTVWPWLLGPFVEAWVRVRRSTVAARREARRRFLDPVMPHLAAAGLGHVSEITDAEPPFTPRGCPFQAWSVGELLRLEREVLRTPATRRGRQRSQKIDGSLHLTAVSSAP